MTNYEIHKERRLSSTKYRKEYKRDTKRVRATEEVTRKEHARRFLTVVVGEGPRHVLRRPMPV